MARLSTANDVMNRVATEIGLPKSTDPVSSSDETFIQLRGLLDSAGQELVELNQWQILEREYSFTTVEGDTGEYDLPDDFSAMIDQTGWDRTNNLPIGGPLSSQDWAYLVGRDLVSQTIYASFQLQDNKLQLFPQPPPEDLEVSFSYLSRAWLASGTDMTNRFDTIQTGSDIVLFEPILIVKFLKVKMLEAKGFDASAARLEFDTVFDSRTGKDSGAAVLSASGGTGGMPYLTPYRNVGDTGYGM